MSVAALPLSFVLGPAEPFRLMSSDAAEEVCSCARLLLIDLQASSSQLSAGREATAPSAW